MSSRASFRTTKRPDTKRWHDLLVGRNFPKAAGELLLNLGHLVHDFRGTAEEGMPDSVLFEKAQALNAILLTTDRDFFHTIPLLHEYHAGIVVVALRQPNRDAILLRLKWFLANIPESAFANRAFQLRDKTWLAFPPVG